MASSIATPNNNGGYDYDFVSQPPDRLICKVCHLPSRDPYLSVCCGHVFCKSCLDNVKKATVITNACPVCRDEEFITFPNKQLDREVKSLHIYCTNKGKGCEWQGELNDINSHRLENRRQSCQFQRVKCSNECGKMIQRRYLTSHVKTKCPRRKVNCQYCHDTGEHQFIKDLHKEECPKLPLPCPNKCEVGSVPREDMEAHRKECPLEMIQCEYYSVGCKQVKLARKDQEKHDNEKMKEHLMMTKNELTSTKAQLDVALKQINSLAMLVNAQLCPNIGDADFRSIQLDTMVMMFKYTCPVTIKMPEFKDKKKSKIEWYSDPFYTHSNGYKMCLCVDADGCVGTHLSVYLNLMKGPHDDELTWPLRGEFEIKLLNQISDTENYFDTVKYHNYDDDDDDNDNDNDDDDDDDDNDHDHDDDDNDNDDDDDDDDDDNDDDNDDDDDDYDDDDDDDNDDDDYYGVPDECANRVTGCERAIGWGESKFISNNNLRKITPTCQFLKDDCLFFQINFKT